MTCVQQRIKSLSNAYLPRSTLSFSGLISLTEKSYVIGPNCSGQFWSSNGKYLMLILQKLLKIAGFAHNILPSE